MEIISGAIIVLVIIVIVTIFPTLLVGHVGGWILGIMVGAILAHKAYFSGKKTSYRRR